jgi:hypothetical protein
MNGSGPDEECVPTPPSAARVAARSLALAAVTCRGFVENDAAESSTFWARVRSWIASLAIDDELEPYERELIDAPLGALEPQQPVDATWLCEGLAVLAWSLGRITIPSYDSKVVAADVADSLGFLSARGETILAAPRFRPAEEIDEFREALFAIHWRLREYSLHRAPLDFEAFSRTASFGPLSLSQARLAGGDLAIGSVPITQADAGALRQCVSIVQERHRAANWLAGFEHLYSEVTTDT